MVRLKRGVGFAVHPQPEREEKVRDTEKFFRDAHSDATAALQRIRERPGAASVLLDADDIEAGLKALDLAIDILAEHDKQAKARRDRIQWVYCGLQTFVAKYKGRTYRYSGEYHRVDVDTKWGWREVGSASNIEAAKRKIRARKK
jgi:hypothetical protein